MVCPRPNPLFAVLWGGTTSLNRPHGSPNRSPEPSDDQPSEPPDLMPKSPWHEEPGGQSPASWSGGRKDGTHTARKRRKKRSLRGFEQKTGLLFDPWFERSLYLSQTLHATLTPKTVVLMRCRSDPCSRRPGDGQSLRGEFSE